MKNTKNLRIVTIVLAVALAICSVAMVCVSASTVIPGGEETDYIKVVSKNASYKAKTELLYAVEVDEASLDMSNSDTVYMLFWNSAQTGSNAYTFETASYRVYNKYKETQGEHAGRYIFASDGINACDISKTIYARPAVKFVDFVDGELKVSYKYGELVEYSVADYANEMLAKDNLDEKHVKLYNALLTYGEEAKKLADKLLGQ